MEKAFCVQLPVLYTAASGENGSRIKSLIASEIRNSKHGRFWTHNLVGAFGTLGSTIP